MEMKVSEVAWAAQRGRRCVGCALHDLRPGRLEMHGSGQGGCHRVRCVRRVQGCSEVRVLCLDEATQVEEAEAEAGWRLLLGMPADLACLAVDHWRQGVFVLLADSDDAPDGQVLAVDIRQPEQHKVRQRHRLSTTHAPGLSGSCDRPETRPGGAAGGAACRCW